VKLVSMLVLLGASAAPALAQVGHPPDQSPYHDVPYKQELTVFGGWFGGNAGNASVGPRAGAMAGVRYSIRLGGPVEFAGRFARVSSTRTVIDPTKGADLRTIGDVSVPLYLADVGLDINLTGQKSWHGLVPVAGFGIGVASDAGANRDVGGFKVGTPFALTFGGGLRYVTQGNWSVRAEVADYLFQLSYPSSYTVAPAAGEPVLPANAATNQWTHNAALTLGVSYLFSR
jgi:Outer membrane protein beta-barrel domain